MFFGFLRLLPSGGDCLIEFIHWQFCFAGEIEFLHEFSLLTGTMYWTLRRILSSSLKTVGPTRLSFCRMSVAFGKRQELFFFHLFAILTRFWMVQRFFWKNGWLFFRCSMTNAPDCWGLLAFNFVVNNSRVTIGSVLLILRLWTVYAILCKCVKVVNGHDILLFGYFLLRELIQQKYSWLEDIREFCGVKLQRDI